MDDGVPRCKNGDSSFYINLRRNTLFNHVVTPLCKAAYTFDQGWEEQIPLKSSRNERKILLGQYTHHRHEDKIERWTIVNRDQARFFDDERLSESDLKVK